MRSAPHSPPATARGARGARPPRPLRWSRVSRRAPHAKLCGVASTARCALGHSSAAAFALPVELRAVGHLRLVDSSACSSALTMPLCQEAATGVQHNCSYMLSGCCAPVAADSTTAAAACRSDRVERFDANDAAVAAADAADAADAAPDRGPRAAHGEHSEADGGRRFAPTLPHIFGSRWMQLDARGGFELRYGAGRPDGAVQPDARGSGA